MSSFCGNCGKWKDGELCPFCGERSPEVNKTPTQPGLMHCPGCGRWVDINEPYCPKCGKEVAVKEKDPSIKEKWVFKPKTAREGMTHCPHCNKRVSTTVVFCPECGKNVNKPFNEHAFCPNCGTALKETAAFCPECGIRTGK